jgi:hypothetical protein
MCLRMVKGGSLCSTNSVGENTHGHSAEVAASSTRFVQPNAQRADFIESLRSRVFCTAAIIDASLQNPVGVKPHIIRVNPRPGSVE